MLAMNAGHVWRIGGSQHQNGAVFRQESLDNKDALTSGSSVSP